jgi:hypothetical protein
VDSSWILRTARDTWVDPMQAIRRATRRRFALGHREPAVPVPGRTARQAVRASSGIVAAQVRNRARSASRVPSSTNA